MRIFSTTNGGQVSAMDEKPSNCNIEAIFPAFKTISPEASKMFVLEGNKLDLEGDQYVAWG